MPYFFSNKQITCIQAFKIIVKVKRITSKARHVGRHNGPWTCNKKVTRNTHSKVEDMPQQKVVLLQVAQGRLELQMRHVYKNGKEDNVETISLYVHINIVCNPYLKLSHCDGSSSPVLLIHFSGQIRKNFSCPAKIFQSYTA